MSGEKVCVVRLTLERKFRLYAFPADVVPTDERGMLLGEDEIGQLVETATKTIHAELTAANKELASARDLIDQLQDAAATANRDRVLEEMTNGKS